MPRLMLLRHAKAGAKPPGGRDFDRPLDDDGRREAALIGRELAARGWRPERALASPARRTRETLEAVLRALGGEAETAFLPDLYEATAEDYAALIRAHGGAAETLLVVGHSPGIRDAAVALTAAGDPLRDRLADAYPTAALAVVDADGAWGELRPGRGSLAAYLRPADLGG